MAPVHFVHIIGYQHWTIFIRTGLGGSAQPSRGTRNRGWRERDVDRQGESFCWAYGRLVGEWNFRWGNLSQDRSLCQRYFVVRRNRGLCRDTRDWCLVLDDGRWCLRGLVGRLGLGPNYRGWDVWNRSSDVGVPSCENIWCRFKKGLTKPVVNTVIIRVFTVSISIGKMFTKKTVIRQKTHLPYLVKTPNEIKD